MKASDVKLKVQEALGIPAEKRAPNIGPLTRSAFERLAVTPNDTDWIEVTIEPARTVRASSFADPADVAAFRKCKAAGKSDQECFKVGDNGVGLWGDDTTADLPMCALPREDWQEKWGKGREARGKKVIVTANGRTVTCELRDTMPSRANIKNGAGIDLNPAAVKALGLRPPVMVNAIWRWA